MAHLVEQMAYVGETPWHGLGNPLSPKQPLDVWKRQAGMAWQIKETPVCYQTEAQILPLTAPHLFPSSSPVSTPTTSSRLISSLHRFDEQKVLYRSDTLAPLSVVSKRYQVVQPGEILEFYRSLVESAGYELETAGVLKGGRKFWALAKTGQSTTIGRKDHVNGYLLLATSCDGTLATTATPTTIRVVCNNTLAIAVNGNHQAIKVPHSTVFKSEIVKKQLGIAVSQWDGFMYRMKQLSKRTVQSTEAKDYFIHVLCPDHISPAFIKEGRPLPNEKAIKHVMQMYEGHGRGAELGAAKGTAWGLLSAVTEYVDHSRRARSQDHRLDSAWFGQGMQIKQKALDQALALV
ncbi:MAG: DUF932 domain-containing protein [Saezia sp.]